MKFCGQCGVWCFSYERIVLKCVNFEGSAVKPESRTVCDNLVESFELLFKYFSFTDSEYQSHVKED